MTSRVLLHRPVLYRCATTTAQGSLCYFFLLIKSDKDKLELKNQSTESIFFLRAQISINFGGSELGPSSSSSVDKCVELPLSGCLIVRAKKYEATFIRTNNGVTHTHTQTTAEGGNFGRNFVL